MSTYYIGAMAVSDWHDVLHYGRKGMHWGKRTFIDDKNQQGSMYINSNPAWVHSLRRKRALKKRILAKVTNNGSDRENIGLKKDVVSNPTTSSKTHSRSYSGYTGYSSTSTVKVSAINKPASQSSSKTTTSVKKEERYAANHKTAKSSAVGKKLAGKISKK